MRRFILGLGFVVTALVLAATTPITPVQAAASDSTTASPLPFVLIYGPSYSGAGPECTWHAYPYYATPPYTFTWTSSGMAGGPVPSYEHVWMGSLINPFGGTYLQVTVTDALNRSFSEILYISYGAEGC
jgi:hypothetical protein